MAITAQGAGPRSRRGAETRAATLYLALFLALLVIFIFLVSRTTFDPARSVAVIEGVEAQFAARGSAQSPDVLPSPAVFGAAPAGLVADARIGEGLAAVMAELGLPASTQPVAGHAHLAAVAPSVLFIRNTAAFTAAGDRAVAALGALLAGSGPGTVRRIDLDVGGAPVLAMRRAAVLGAALAAAAGPQAVTVRAGGGTAVLLTVYATPAGEAGR